MNGALGSAPLATAEKPCGGPPRSVARGAHSQDFAVAVVGVYDALADPAKPVGEDSKAVGINVRLTRAQIDAIARIVRRLTGGTAEVYLFGSRLDDRARGGDVDLLIETAIPLTLLEKARIRMELEAQVGLPVDLLFQIRDVTPTAFQRVARANAVRLRARP